MSRQSRRVALIAVGVLMALVAIGQYLGWLDGPPALLAPGIH
ncbi:MAG: hypothetical protein WBD07_00345 [Vicinamibacterales bacterium]